MHELPQNHFDNKQYGTLFSLVHIECAETKNKTRSTYVKNSYIALLYIDYCIIVVYIIDLLYISISIYLSIYLSIYIYIYIYIKKGECKKTINILTTSFE